MTKYIETLTRIGLTEPAQRACVYGTKLVLSKVTIMDVDTKEPGKVNRYTNCILTRKAEIK
jgi:hypothetical protein